VQVGLGGIGTIEAARMKAHPVKSWSAVMPRWRK
jgi:hypothetical protein